MRLFKQTPEDYYNAPYAEFPALIRGTVVVVMAILWAFSKLMWRWKVEDADLLFERQDGRGSVVICNHTSMAELLAVETALFFGGRRIRPIFKSEFAKSKIVRWAFSRVGGIPVERGTADMKCLRLRHARRSVRRASGQVLAMSENVTNTSATASNQAIAPTIEIAAHAGTCYGVQRALDMALAAAPQAGECTQVHTLGPLIHNPIVVRELDEAGVGLADTLDDATSGTVIIRAHGVVPQVIDAAHDRGLTVVDATCPYVKKVHMAAERLVREGYHVVVVGEPGHPEVEGILGHAGDDAQVVSCAADADALPLKGKVGLVVQTTQTAQNLADVVAAITPRVQELRVINTICAATSERQQAAAALANRCDCMVVVGGKNSGNTRRLAQICADACEHTHHIEEASELEAAWFAGARHIGITAGASTPQEHIERAVARIKELCR